MGRGGENRLRKLKLFKGDLDFWKKRRKEIDYLSRDLFVFLLRFITHFYMPTKLVARG